VDHRFFGIVAGQCPALPAVIWIRVERHRRRMSRRNVHSRRIHGDVLDIDDGTQISGVAIAD
jgi:hypothetical protein